MHCDDRMLTLKWGIKARGASHCSQRCTVTMQLTKEYLVYYQQEENFISRKDIYNLNMYLLEDNTETGSTICTFYIHVQHMVDKYIYRLFPCFSVCLLLPTKHFYVEWKIFCRCLYLCSCSHLVFPFCFVFCLYTWLIFHALEASLIFLCCSPWSLFWHPFVFSCSKPLLKC